ncbi:hypothetical protein GCM10008938_46650 [Deinococcus roseus]|uniref:Uncharacterized protein n=1 Tax=Deinococcus roseus TaxID=392414 RepID=A0ABQ2DEH6_9DEIO|nr:hypothetical protein GCM10008938_46650 [Deinococcus roseus]
METKKLNGLYGKGETQGFSDQKWEYEAGTTVRTGLRENCKKMQGKCLRKGNLE